MLFVLLGRTLQINYKESHRTQERIVAWGGGSNSEHDAPLHSSSTTTKPHEPLHRGIPQNCVGPIITLLLFFPKESKLTFQNTSYSRILLLFSLLLPDNKMWTKKHGLCRLLVKMALEIENPTPRQSHQNLKNCRRWQTSHITPPPQLSRDKEVATLCFV